MKKLLTCLLSFTIIFSPVYVFAEEEDLTLPASPEPVASEAPTTTETNTTTEEPKEENKEEETKTEEPTTTPTTTGTTEEPETKEETKTEEPEPEPEPVVKTCTFSGIEVIKGGKLDQDFDEEVTTYNLTIDDDAKDDLKNKFKIQANITEGCNVMIGGNINDYSKLAGNQITITITSDNPVINKQYVFKVAKEKKPIEEGITAIRMPGYPFNETFSKELRQYTTEIPYNLERITINLTLVDENSVVTLVNQSAGSVTQNGKEVTILYRNLSDEITKIEFLVNEEKYTVLATRGEKGEVEEKQTEIITEPETTTDDDNNKDDTLTVDSKDKKDLEKKDVKSPDTFLNMLIITLGSIIMFTIGVLGIVLFVKTSPKRMKKEVIKIKTQNDKEKEENSPIIEVKEEPKTNKIETLDDEKTMIFETNKDE